MRRRGKGLLSILLCILLSLGLLPDPEVSAEEDVKDYDVEILSIEYAPKRSISSSKAAKGSSWYTEDAVYERLMAMKSSYPEGMPWTEANTYENVYLWYGGMWNGSYVRFTGYACYGFALIMSDAAFGTDIPIWQDDEVSFSKVRVGDILRVSNDSHSVVVLEVNQNSVTIAEGNYNRSIHWGRTLSAWEVENADYLLTRWPGVPQPPAEYTVSYDANGGTGAPETQNKIPGQPLTLNNIRPVREGYFFLGWAESVDATTALYQPGDAFNRDANTTLYAVWEAPDLILPASLTDIGNEALAGGAFRFAKLPERAVSISKNAFANCESLLYIYIPAATTDIDSEAFGEKTDLTIIGQIGSAAAYFAQAHGFTFLAAS